ncbi:hypothetical protein [Streptomyces sp. ODS28]|uniref:hypothetical protein n=1 Tax=Streptomyces sp. ODS28 TaxID=3136688 RepID=UPI0031E59730
METELADAEQAHARAEYAEQHIAAVRAECDVIEREQHGQHDEDADGMREAVRRIRAVLNCPSCADRLAHDGHCPYPETHNTSCGCTHEAERSDR